MKDKPIVAISGCLAGEEIRHDRQHKKSPYIAHELSNYFTYKSFCPEVSMGLGIPRSPIKLVKMKREDPIQLVDSKDPRINHTELAMKTFSKIEKEVKSVSGIIFASKSPSCGYDPVNVSDAKSGISVTKSKGLWAKHLESLYPLIPKISSGRLYDTEQRDTFRTQVMVYNDFTSNVSTPHQLIKFHETYKYYFMQYGAIQLKCLGRICAGISNKNNKDKILEYSEYLFGTLFKKKITNKNRTNVFEHLAGYFKKCLNVSDKKYLHENIKAYYKDNISFNTLLTLIEFLSMSYEQVYLKDQKIFKLYSQRTL
jgi:uncharacterized protein YbbK (DUF523 family)/uncharacterized protein YbgA (DUF1722 family)